MKTVKTIGKQTLLDLAMQYYGNIEAVSEIIGLNPGLVNNPSALYSLIGCKCGIHRIDIENLYLDVELQPDQEVTIDERSDLAKKNIIKNINKPVTTYDDGKNN